MKTKKTSQSHPWRNDRLNGKPAKTSHAAALAAVKKRQKSYGKQG